MRAFKRETLAFDALEREIMMTAFVQEPAHHLRPEAIQDGSYGDMLFSPYDGAIYRVITWVVQGSEGAARFFAIARPGTPFTGAFVPLDDAWTFCDYVELFGASEDIDLETLWAGWRVLRRLSGRDDQAPPDDLPEWRPDWHTELRAIPRLAT